MSGKATGMVWELDIPHNQQFVLLAMADHADHNGGHIFPSTAEIAWKTGYSHRQVQRIIKELRDNKAIELTKANYGRYGTNCYRIAWENIPKKQPIIRDDKMSLRQNVIPSNSRDDKKTMGGDTQMSPDPSSDPSKEKDSMEPEVPEPAKSKRKPDPIFDWIAETIFKVTADSAHDDTDTNKWIGANAAKLVNAEKKLLGIPQSKPLNDECRRALAAQLPGMLKFYNQQSPGLSPPQARTKFGKLVLQWYGAGKPFSAVLQEVKYAPIEHDNYVAPSEVA